MSHFTGGCHYSAGCDGFERDCAPCPQVIDTLAMAPSLLAVRRRTYRRANVAGGGPIALVGKLRIALRGVRAGIGAAHLQCDRNGPLPACRQGRGTARARPRPVAPLRSVRGPLHPGNPQGIRLPDEGDRAAHRVFAGVRGRRGCARLGTAAVRRGDAGNPVAGHSRDIIRLRQRRRATGSHLQRRRSADPSLPRGQPAQRHDGSDGCRRAGRGLRSRRHERHDP